MKVLIACEFSGTVRDAFREKGHEAWSCDLVESETPGPHLLGDVSEYLGECQANNYKGWDLMIAHPPCTYLTVTGNKWMKPEYESRFPTRKEDRRKGIEFFMKLVNAPIDRVAIENPIGIMSSLYRKPDQIIQPWQFGHQASKSTCLWLKNLPLLKPENIVEKGEFTTFKSGKRMTKWYADAAKLSPKERERVRNKTFQGIANAFANQWSNLTL